MKLDRVRIGVRFVFEDRGGIWEKMTETKARCFFGKREEQGSEIDISPETFVFALLERPGRRDSVGGMRIVAKECYTGETLLDTDEVGPAQIAAMVSAEGIQMVPAGKRKLKRYLVMETCVDVDENVLLVSLREEKTIGKEEEKDDVPVDEPVNRLAGQEEDPRDDEGSTLPGGRDLSV